MLHVNGQLQLENNLVLNENTPAITIPNGDLRIFTGGAESMRIDSDGKVGIGNTAPNAMLEVGKSTTAAGTLVITHEDVGGYGSLDIDSYGSATIRLLSNFSGSAINGMPDDTFSLQTPHNYPILFGTSGIERARIHSGGGLSVTNRLNVGSTVEPTAISGEHLRIDSAGDNTPLISMVQSNTRLASIGAYYSSQVGSYIFLGAPEGSTDRTAIQTHRFYGDGAIATTLGGSGTMTKWFQTDGNYFTLGGLPSTATQGAGNIHSLAMIQSGKITWGDWTDSNPLGICEGQWNEEGTDRDYLGIHFRSSLTFYGSYLTQRAKLLANGNFSIGYSGSAEVGYLHVGKDWGASNHRINRAITQPGAILVVSGYGASGCTADTALFFTANVGGRNAADTAVAIEKNSGTSRSINAAGTINASGSDYAEYILKSDTCGDNAKGDIVGIDSNSKLTDKWSEAHSFVVKSTNPSYVGGDTWGNEDTVGKRPELTTQNKDGGETNEEYAVRTTQYEALLATFNTELEAQRIKYDRISFSGQVPVNITGASVGDYIIPKEGASDSITGEAVSSPTFEQYQKAVGKVWKILDDGRAWVSIKVG
jgi:hypothetical protein